MNNAIPLRARSVGEILDASFQILRQHYGAIAAASTILLAPVLVLRFLFPGAAMELLLSFVQNVLTNYVTAATVVIVSDFYMGRGVDVQRALRLVGSRWGAVLVAAILQGILIGVGMILLVIPGIIFFAWSFAMPIVVMVEGSEAGDAFGRSKSLVEGHFWHVLGSAFVAWLIVMIASMGAAAVVGVMGAVSSLVNVAALIEFAMLALFYPFAAVVYTVLYYDLRIRKEGLDLQMMTQQMETAFTAPAPAVR